MLLRNFRKKSRNADIQSSNGILRNNVAGQRSKVGKLDQGIA